MTQEHVSLVRIRLPELALVDELARSAAIALRRCLKALPGDRADAVRFEMLVSKIEMIAERTVRDDPSSEIPWPGATSIHGVPVFQEGGNLAGIPSDAQRLIAAGAVLVVVVRPLVSGDTQQTTEPSVETELMPAAEMWDSGGIGGREAVTARFRAQLATAISDGGSICPSGVSNSVVTNVLREFAAGSAPVSAAVVYRDGSSGPNFPLRSVALTTRSPIPEHKLRFSLLSIRHTEMDVEVDGAWLRNTRVSRPVPAGETDRLVYELSKRQLTRILGRGPATIVMYQTGLETAVVGFYRAVLEQLVKSPGSLAVVPMFYRSPRSDDEHATYTEGEVWAV